MRKVPIQHGRLTSHGFALVVEKSIKACLTWLVFDRIIGKAKKSINPTKLPLSPAIFYLKISACWKVLIILSGASLKSPLLDIQANVLAMGFGRHYLRNLLSNI